MNRIHIVGCSPRSGTTLMAEAMKVCFEIDCSTDHEDSIFRHTHQACNIYLTKKPGDIMRVRPFLTAMPNLYVIFMIRDPRDIVVSRHGSKPDQYWCGLGYWKTYIKYFRQISGHPRVLPIRYEDFVHDPDQVQRRILAHMPFLNQRVAFSEFHLKATPSVDSSAALRGVRAITDTSIGRWRHDLARIASQISTHGDLSSELIEFGYETSDDWTKILEGIDPSPAGSVLPEFLPGEMLRRITRESWRKALKYYLSQRGIGLHYLARWL